MEIRPVGDEFFHVHRWIDRQTDMTMLIVAFRNFANASEKYTEFACCFFYGCEVGVSLRERKEKYTKLET